MRILLSTSLRGHVGGIETHVAALAPALAARGHAVAFLFEEDAGPGLPRVDAGVPGAPAWCTRVLGEAAALAAAGAWAPDVVHLHGADSLALEEALVARLPCVRYVHTYTGTCVSGTKRHLWPRPQPCRRILGPACLAHYLPRRCGGLSPVTAVRAYGRQQAWGALLRRTPALVVASDAMREELVRHGVPPARVHVLAPLAGAQRGGRPAPRPPVGRVLFLGRLYVDKGLAHLLRALPRASTLLGRPLQLDVAGEGPERARAEALARALRVPARFHGRVGPAEREALLAGCDVLAVPSLWPEPFGLVGVEAAGAGVPAVAYDTGGIRAWCTPGVSGELAPADPPTPEGLAAALARALGDAAHLARLRTGAWESAERFTTEAHLAGLVPLLEARAGVRQPADHIAAHRGAGGPDE